MSVPQLFVLICLRQLPNLEVIAVSLRFRCWTVFEGSWDIYTRLPERAHLDYALTVRGSGTILNMVAILIGSGLGVLIGHRLPQRTRDTVTDALGLVTLVIGALSLVALTSTAFSESVGKAAPLLIVLGALVIGGIIGSLLQIELRLERVGGWLQRKLNRSNGIEDGDKRHRFVEGFVDASLVFCIGPLAILGALNDGLGLGIEQLALKSTLDGFASLAFAASLGWGVALSALSVGIVQGAFTLTGALVGSVLSTALIDAITATGGVLLIGVGLRLLKVKSVPVGDMLPALLIAPILAALVAVFIGS